MSFPVTMPVVRINSPTIPDHRRLAVIEGIEYPDVLFPIQVRFLDQDGEDAIVYADECEPVTKAAYDVLLEAAFRDGIRAARKHKKSS